VCFSISSNLLGGKILNLPCSTVRALVQVHDQLSALRNGNLRDVVCACFNMCRQTIWAISLIRCGAVSTTGKFASSLSFYRAWLLARLPGRPVARGPFTASCSSSCLRSVSSCDAVSAATSASRRALEATSSLTAWSTA